MKQFLLSIFTWWNGATLNTMLWSNRHGEKVGSDEFGNTYYHTRGGKIDKALGFQRRWVIYNGPIEASIIPPGWNGWLHHTVDTPPSKEDYQPRAWQIAHKPNMTGTPNAYHPQGSLARGGQRVKVSSDYQPWNPNS